MTARKHLFSFEEVSFFLKVFFVYGCWKALHYAVGTTINITPLHSTWVAEHCLAIPAMFVFGFSMLLFKGKAKDKAWFIPLGIFVIFLLNLFRLVSLSILMTQLSETTYQVYHRYVFLVLTYGAILWIVFWWMDRVMKEPEVGHYATQ